MPWRNALVLAAAWAALAGCASRPWSNLSNPSADLQADRDRCVAEADRPMPPLTSADSQCRRDVMDEVDCSAPAISSRGDWQHTTDERSCLVRLGWTR